MVRFFRRRGAARPAPVRRTSDADIAHLEQFARSRRGVEAYVEPRTTVTAMTVVLIAADGEWTRRRVDGWEAARALGRDLEIPVYDIAATGYPQRMREWNRQRKLAGDSRVAGAGRPTPAAERGGGVSLPQDRV